MRLPGISSLVHWFRSGGQDVHSRVATIREQLLAKEISQNTFYDLLTEMVIQKVCGPGDFCIDVGCHRGEILDWMIAAADGGKFAAFEPLPEFFCELQDKYLNDDRVQVFQVALAETKGATTFQHVVSNPAYSGFRKRSYDRPDEQTQSIEVATDRLDDLIHAQTGVRLIKIDVEGAELMVMRGAEQILKTHKPFVIFEHARGGVKFYDYGPEDLYDFLADKCALQISTLDCWLLNEPPMDRERFLETFGVCSDYYFVAHTEGNAVD